MTAYKKTIILLLVTVCIGLVYIFYNRPEKPVKIGFIADFTGQNSSFGIQARNGVLMAIDEVNLQGGVHGRQFDLITIDNKNDKEKCRAAVLELLEKKVPVIIGPLISKMAKLVIDTAGDKCLIISPSVSTTDVMGMNDNFIRINSSAKTDGNRLASKVIEEGNTTVGIVWSQHNIEYTSSVVDGLKERLRQSSVKINFESVFNDYNHFPELINSLKESTPDALIVVAKGKDSAAFIQQYAKLGDLPKLYSCKWSKVSNILSFGGKTVEGMITLDQFKNKNPTDREINFEQKYQALFSMEPNFGSVYAYEAFMLFVEGAKKASPHWDIKAIKSEILKIDSFQGISEKFRLDKNGDAVRKTSFYQIRDNKYIICDEKN